MTVDISKVIRNATQLTRSGDVGAATAVIKSVLNPASSSPRYASKVVEADLPAPLGNHPPSDSDFSLRSFQWHNEVMHYRLYSPSRRDRAMPLIVMLHGCAQDALGFSIGTQMNQVAESRGLHVLYPQQTNKRNPQNCWNWFDPQDQHRGGREPDMIAELTRSMIQQNNIDPSRIYIAGLSAGGAMAAILGIAYPELFAAVGVHSGLAPGCAHDIPSAIRAMKTGAAGRFVGRGIPAIVFHGLDDRTVSSKNAAQVLAAFVGDAGFTSEVSSDGRYRSYRITGSPVDIAELWMVPGMGHMWSGGSSRGSYASDQGPNASSEMVRFFSCHKRSGS